MATLTVRSPAGSRTLTLQAAGPSDIAPLFSEEWLGSELWPAATALVRVLEQEDYQARLRAATLVLELGSGTGAVGLAAAVLGARRVLITDLPALKAFCLGCECLPHGGIAKCAGNHPDVLHSYYAICGLSIAGLRPLLPLDCRLGISSRAAVAAGLAEPSCLEAEPDAP